MKQKLLVGALMSAVVLQGATAAVLAAEPADLVLFNGKVLTVDKAFTIHQAIAVKDGKVLAVGDDSITKQYTATTTIDLKGRTLLPGFNDNHFHPGSRSPRSVDIEDVESIAKMQDLLRKKARELGPGEWITGYGWDEAKMKEKRVPVKEDLDAAAPNNPVALTRAGAHSVVGNSLALKAAGITRTTEDPKSGLIERGKDGEPNGIIRERGDLYGSLVPRDKDEVLRPSVLIRLRKLTALGLTSINVAGAGIYDELPPEAITPDTRGSIPRTRR